MSRADQTRKRGQGPSYQMPESSRRVFPRDTPASPDLVPVDSPGVTPPDWPDQPDWEPSFVYGPPLSTLPMPSSSATPQGKSRLSPWMAPGALAQPAAKGPGGTYLIRDSDPTAWAGQAQKGTIIYKAGFFSVDYARALEYANRVEQEMKNGVLYPMGKEQQVYEPFIVPFNACVFWKKYTYLDMYLGRGAFGVVLGFDYHGKHMAVKFQQYKSGDPVDYKDMVNEIAMNALINQLPAERRFGVVQMYDWARCHFSFEEAIGKDRATELSKKPNLSFIMRPNTYQMIVFERGGSNLNDVFVKVAETNDYVKSFRFWSAAYLQIVATQFYLWRNLRFRHLDLHWKNVLTKPEPDTNKTDILYIFRKVKGNDVYYRVPLANTNNLLMMIGDMGRASSESGQLIRDSVFDNPTMLILATHVDLMYIEDMWRHLLLTSSSLLHHHQDLKDSTINSMTTLAKVKQTIVGYQNNPGLGYIDFETLIIETDAFDQYKTDQPQERPTDRVMEVTMAENMMFTPITGSRTR